MFASGELIPIPDRSTSTNYDDGWRKVYPVHRAAKNMSTKEPVVHSDPEIMSGTPVFVGTRVPFQTLLDYIEAGQPLSEFLEDFPTVSKDQAIVALEQAKEALLARARPV